jgi:hypothetical protein
LVDYKGFKDWVCVEVAKLDRALDAKSETKSVSKVSVGAKIKDL